MSSHLIIMFCKMSIKQEIFGNKKAV